MKKTIDSLLIIYSAFVSSSLIYLLVGFILNESNWKAVLQDSKLQLMLFLVFVLISFLLIVLASRIRQEVFSEDLPRLESLEMLQRYVISKYIILFVLSEVPAVFGLVFFLLSGNFARLLILCLLSFLALALIRPSRQFLEDMARRLGFQPSDQQPPIYRRAKPKG